MALRTSSLKLAFNFISGFSRCLWCVCVCVVIMCKHACVSKHVGGMFIKIWADLRQVSWPQSPTCLLLHQAYLLRRWPLHVGATSWILLTHVLSLAFVLLAQASLNLWIICWHLEIMNFLMKSQDSWFSWEKRRKGGRKGGTQVNLETLGQLPWPHHKHGCTSPTGNPWSSPSPLQLERLHSLLYLALLSPWTGVFWAHKRRLCFCPSSLSFSSLNRWLGIFH